VALAVSSAAMRLWTVALAAAHQPLASMICSVHTPEFTTPSAALQPLRRLTNRRCAIDHDQADADNLVAPCTHVGPGLSSRPPATSRMDGGALT